jgi:hypothetical protein
MPFTLVAWSESQDEAGAFTPMTACADQHVRTAGDSIFVPEYNTLVGAAALVGTVGQHARLVSPSLRRVNPYHINPVEELLVPGNPASHAVFPGIAVPLDAGEQIIAENDANPAAAEQHTVLAWLASGALTGQNGAIRTLRATITLVQTAGVWTFSALDFVDEIPTGRYTVVGGHVIAAGAVAWRIVFVGQWHRPGGLVAQVDDQLGLDIFRAGWLGAWGTFEQATPPVIELLGSAAAVSATYDVYLDVIPG